MTTAKSNHDGEKPSWTPAKAHVTSSAEYQWLMWFGVVRLSQNHLFKSKCIIDFIMNANSWQTDGDSRCVIFPSHSLMIIQAECTICILGIM